MFASFMSSYIEKFIKRDFYSLTGVIFFLFFFILSVVFYIECTTFESYAIELSYGISQRAFDIIYTIRWGITPFRIWALLGPFLDWSLQTMLLLTSAWYIILKFIGWMVCYFYFKNPLAGLLIIVSIIFSFNEGFYAQVLQMYDASLYFCLLFAILQDEEYAAVIKKRWVRVMLIILLLILIKGTHIIVFLICPLLLFYYTYDKYSHEKLLYFIVIAVISVLYLTVLGNYHEDDYMKGMWNVLLTKNFRDLSGLFVYLLKEVVSLNFLFPLIALLLLVRHLVKKEKYFLLVVTIFYLGVLALLVFLRLASFDVTYPLSNDPKYYFQGAFYSLLFVIVSLWFYEIKNTSIVNSTVFKTAIVFILIFYTSSITASGIEKKEYNIYLEALLAKLDRDYKEQIFILHPNHFPYRFSKVNSLVEYETMIKSNLWLNKSVVLYVTPFTAPLTIDGEFPVFANCAYQVNKSNVLDPLSEGFKTMSPSHFQHRGDSVYFKFDTYDYAIVSKNYMDSFNHQYGFSINEY
jgi:hypothetical protein